MDFKSDKVVRCFSCGQWVRALATELVNTGERDDIERWCVGCIREVDATTKGLLGIGQSSPILELDEGE